MQIPYCGMYIEVDDIYCYCTDRAPCQCAKIPHLYIPVISNSFNFCIECYCISYECFGISFSCLAVKRSRVYPSWQLTKLGQTVYIFCKHGNVFWKFHPLVRHLSPIENTKIEEVEVKFTFVSFMRISNVSYYNEGTYYCWEKGSNNVASGIIDVARKSLKGTLEIAE